MAETYYFSHDYDASSDIKMMKLLRVHNSSGYGVFWRLTELLYQNDNALYLDYETLSYELREDVNLIKSVINDFDLFIVEDGIFFSYSIRKRLNKRNEKSDKARESANKRWSKNANALQTVCEGNAIKESKVKESKLKETKEKDINITAYNFLKNNSPSELEVFEMKNKKTFSDYEKFIDNFNNKVILDEIEFKVPKLMARLNNLNSNWDKSKKQNKSHTSNIIF